MLAGVGVLAPLAALLARYGKGMSCWFGFHYGIQVCLSVCLSELLVRGPPRQSRREVPEACR
jgi:hypothetical protein